MASDDNHFLAFEIQALGDMPLTVAPVQRPWMDDSENRAAYRCLPMNIANQAGWIIPCPADVTAVWDGGRGPQHVRLDFGGSGGGPDNSGGSANTVITVTGSVAPRPETRIRSQFGSGVVTFLIPYLFRTPEGVNLWVKGPTNWIKDGAQALEGIVETDWLVASFTMNWKLTRPDYPVRFQRGEPICMVVPVARCLAESLEPICLPLGARPELRQQYRDWARSREEFNRALLAGHPEAHRLGWEKDYMIGVMPDGTPATYHQTHLDLKEFQRLNEDPCREDGPS